MTDLDRFLAFLRGCNLPHEVHEGDDVLLLPAQPPDSIAFTRHSTHVSTIMAELYFADDGHFAGWGRPEPEPIEHCNNWDPVTHEPSGLVTCRNCGGSWAGYHERDDEVQQ